MADDGVDIIFEAAVEILVWLNAEKVSKATKTRRERNWLCMGGILSPCGCLGLLTRKGEGPLTGLSGLSHETAAILQLQIHGSQQVGEAGGGAKRIVGWVHLDGNQGAFLIARYEFISTVGIQLRLAVQPYASTAIVTATHEYLSFFLDLVHARSAENSVPGP